MSEAQRVRIHSVHLVPALLTGAWAGFVPGLFIGGVLGAVISFGAGAILAWIGQVGVTTGMHPGLLPFSERIGLLPTLQDERYLVVPATAVGFGVFSGLTG